MDDKLARIFSPQTIAVVGASKEEGKIGNTIMFNLKEAGFKGDIFPINPKEEEIFGYKAYPSIIKTPLDVDLAVIAVPAKVVPSVLETCAQKKIAGTVIISAGFGEAGSGEGRSLEEECLQIAKRGGFRIIGPNCLGIIRTQTNLNASFASKMPLRGKISFISQSGAICSSIIDWSQANNVGFSNFVSIGNMIDVKFTDLISFFSEDEETESILLYIEGLSEGKEFVEAASRVTKKKPVIALKTGRTEAARKAAKSHTGSLAGTDEVYSAIFRKAGIVRVDFIEELFDCAHALSSQPPALGDRLLVITNAGSMGVSAADACSFHGMKLAKLSEGTINKLGEVLPPSWSFGNPVDILGDATPKRYSQAINICLKDEDFDGMVIILTPQAMTDPTQTAKEVCQSLKGFDKPTLAVWMGADDVKEGIKILEESNIPSYFSPGNAVRAFSRLRGYGKYLEFAEITELSRKGIKRIIKGASGDKRAILTEEESKRILKMYKIPVSETEVAASAEEASKVAERIGFPVVMKILSPDITHKSDAGGVKINLSSVLEVKEAFEEIIRRAREYNPKANILGVTVGEMLGPGHEVFMGMNCDPQFGPILVFGLGGIFVEVLKDVSYELAPLNHQRARDMVERIKAFPILEGIRGTSPANIEALADILTKLSRLAEDFSEIRSIDINPVISSNTRTAAADARIELMSEG